MRLFKREPRTMRLRDEWKACLRFVVHPRISRQVVVATPLDGRVRDFMPNIPIARLIGWALTLWVLNIFVLGPFVLQVFEDSGATHRIDVSNLPWFQAIVWAPVVEELLFRYVLRRPLGLLAIPPLMTMVMNNGVKAWSTLLLLGVVLVIILAGIISRPPKAWVIVWGRSYRKVFPWLFHLVALLFAAVHLRNFVFAEVQWWMMVVLVLPQWITGLVLGWMRVQRGIAASILLHALFNVGPLTLAWLALKAGLE